MRRYERTVSGSMRWVPSIRTSRTASPAGCASAAPPRTATLNRISTAATQRPQGRIKFPPSPPASGQPVFQGREEGHLLEIVPGGEDHQHQDERKADSEAVFLRFLAQRAAAHRF